MDQVEGSLLDGEVKGCYENAGAVFISIRFGDISWTMTISLKEQHMREQC